MYFSFYKKKKKKLKLGSLFPEKALGKRFLSSYFSIVYSNYPETFLNWLTQLEQNQEFFQVKPSSASTMYTSSLAGWKITQR